MKRIVPVLAIFFLLGGSVSAFAQNPNSGPSKTFRQGAAWQHAIDKAQEEEKRLRLKVDSYEQHEWMDHALAWIRYDLNDTAITIDESLRVGDVDAGKKAEVARQGDEDEPAWHIAFAKKPPKSLTLILTDQDQTEVACPFKEAPKGKPGLWGVFQDPETTFLHCFWREAPEQTAAMN